LVRELAARLGATVATYDDVTLRAQSAPRDDRVSALTGGVGSVARAAVLAHGATPVTDKRVAGGATYVIALRPTEPPTSLKTACRGENCSPDCSSHHDTQFSGTFAGAFGETLAGTSGGGFDPLRHHGDVDARTARIDLAVNVAVPAPPDWLRRALAAALDDVAAYPDEAPVRRRLAEHLGTEPESLLLVNGAAQAFSLVAHARAWRHPLVVHPQFTEPDAALRAAGYLPRHHLLRADDSFTLRPQAVDAEADLVVVGNPTNPTSRLHGADTLRALLRGAGRERVLLLDEAFIDVVPGERESLQPDACAATATTSRGLLVLRSLTKTFGLAGIRAGYVVGDPRLVARLRELAPPWSVNSLALAAIDAAVTPQARDHVDALAAELPRRRDHLVAGLRAAGLTVVDDPQGPFVLAHHPRAAELRAGLRERGIAVRRGDTFPGLGPAWLRFAVRDEATTDALLTALRALPELAAPAETTAAPEESP
ncbi:Rv2231c family pyridoxal phosphate-dependent protein CobC, partial [Piscicoccus intestinalis]|uniref:Rv2231c family pyridoxal phosphate-dependent protein CobC n=1 Tax=Piscicoccus intestinalis TaxID=746033 RepID=UPI000AB55F22